MRGATHGNDQSRVAAPTVDLASAEDDETGQSKILISWLIINVTTLEETVLQTVAKKDNEMKAMTTKWI